MFTRKSAAIAVTAGACALVIAIPAAFAATTYTVKAGSTTSGKVKYKGATSAITFKDNGNTLTCDSGTASGTITLGANHANPIAPIGATTWVGCKGPGGINLTVQQVGTWKLNASSATSNGVTKGFIGTVKANVSGGGGACNFQVTGAVNGSYNNSTGNLTVQSSAGHQLTISQGANCLNVVNSGDHPTFSAVYKITTPKGKLSVTSN